MLVKPKHCFKHELPIFSYKKGGRGEAKEIPSFSTKNSSIFPQALQATLIPTAAKNNQDNLHRTPHRQERVQVPDEVEALKKCLKVGTVGKRPRAQQRSSKLTILFIAIGVNSLTENQYFRMIKLKKSMVGKHIRDSNKAIGIPTLPSGGL
ncbi:unnamed protein product [Lactuca saligna]|uniref:Uncharacterized protein n=1 Tax=Lactuca saligna TaxID=75948 RepID=A0AA35ZW94_LACSI|nr:unnamed protein product [Lactuca saligna]